MELSEGIAGFYLVMDLVTEVNIELFPETQRDEFFAENSK